MRENTMLHWMRDLDRLLRGEATRLTALRRGSIDLPENGLFLVILALGVLYGLCMGCYALFNKDIGPALMQLISSMAKVPALFFTTLVVTFPSLYVFNALIGSRLTLLSVWRLLIAALAVMLAVLASLGPIVAFFAVSTTSYPFMLLLNVTVFTLSGFLGLKFLLFTLHRLTIVLSDAVARPAVTPRQGAAVDVGNELAKKQAAVSPDPTVPGPPNAGPTGALDRMTDHMLGSDVMTVFYIWIMVFGLVGAQMSWVLRPFISHPDKPFVLFSPRESNFYAAIWNALAGVFS